VPDAALTGFGALSVALGLAGYVPYVRDTLAGRTKPHLFSWLIWGGGTAVAFAGQVRGHGGPGAWVSGVTVAGCATIVALAARNGIGYVTVVDWFCAGGVLAAAGCWVGLGLPVVAIIAGRVVDAAGFVPTLLKSWRRPSEETLSIYVLSAVKFGCAALALARVTVLTALFPLVASVQELAVVVVIVVARRRVVGVLV